MDEYKVYEGLREIAVKQLAEIHQKGSMTVPEAEAAKIAMCLIDMFDEKLEDMGEEEGGYSERSSRRSYARRQSNASYEGGRSRRGSQNSMGYPIYDEEDYFMEGGRGGGGSSRRSSRGSYEGGSYEGRSMRGSYENQRRDNRGRYSSHSINDRIVSMMERMMDGVESEYERQKLQEFMRYIREDEMNE